MNTKKTIRKVLFATMWIVIGGGMLTLLIAAIGLQKRDSCKDYDISLKPGKDNQLFLEKMDIVRILQSAANGKIKGQVKKDLNLRAMEDSLEKNRWIADAQLYFDNNDILHVSIEERSPLARVFTTGNRSYYIDELGRKMDLSDKRTARVPVFTGFPDRKISGGADSLLLDDVIATALFIRGNPFWSSQVAQIDIDRSCGPDCRELNMIPVVGNHIVKLGTGEDIVAKFNRLFIFYKEVMSKSGFDKYKTVDVRFHGQVVAARSENPKVDSVQLRKNVMTMLAQIKEMEKKNEEDAIQANMETLTPATTVSTVLKEETVAAAVDAKEIKESNGTKAPKAVMPKKKD